MTTAPRAVVAPEPQTPETTPRWAFIGWVGFTMLLFYALVIGGGAMGMYVGAVRLLSLAIITTALVVWLIVAWRRPGWRPTTAIWPAFAAPLVAFGLSISFSDHPRIGLDFLSYAVLLTALYLLLVRIMALPYARARIGGVMAAMAIVLGSAYVIWSMQLWIEWWGLVGEFRLPPFRPAHLGMTWGSPSVVMSVLVLMTVSAIGGIGLTTRGARITAVVLVVLLAVVTIVSGSRSGWLSLSGSLVIVGALILLGSRGRVISEVVRSRWFRIVLIPALVALGLIAVVLGPSMISRFGAYGDGGRPTYWATAWRMFEDAPFLGQGPGTWMIRRVTFTEPGELDLYMPHAHNQYLQTVAELGLVGLAAGVIAFGMVGWLLVRALRGDDSVRRRWAWASVFGLTYLALNVVVDVHTIPTVALLMGLPIAVLDATTRRGIRLPLIPGSVACWLRNAALVLLVLACAASIMQLVRTESTALTHQQAVTAAGGGEWAEALAPALDAVAADPDFGAYQVTAALALAANEEWAAAEKAYRRAVEIDGLPDAWLGLARVGVELGWPAEEVAATLNEALRLGEQQAAVSFAAGRVYDLTGMTAEADDAYIHTLSLVPSLAADADWQAELGPEHFSGIVDGAITAAPEQGWEIALMAGEGDRARELAADRPDAVFYEQVISAWEGDAEAFGEMKAMVDATPEDPTRLSLAARVSDHLGDPESARKYSRLTRLGPLYGPMTVNAGYGDRDPLADAPMGTSTHFYGAFTYRRALPVDLLPPGLPGMVISTNVVDKEPDQTAP